MRFALQLRVLTQSSNCMLRICAPREGFVAGAQKVIHDFAGEYNSPEQDDAQGANDRQMFWLIQIFTKLPLLFSKLSLTFVYRDLMHMVDHPVVKVARWVNYSLMVVLTGFFTAATLVSMFACTPVQKSWLPKTPGSCIDTKIMFNYVTSSVNITTSICLICIPLPVLYLAKNKRIEIKQLTALVLFGIMYAVVSPALRLELIFSVIP